MKTQNTTQTIGAQLVETVVASLAALLTLAGCNQNLGTSSYQPTESLNMTAPVAVTFVDVKEKVFVPHCLKCHSSDVQKGDIDLERYETAFAVTNMIRDEVTADRMPRRAPPLAPELKALLFAWIDAGAPEK